MSLSNFQCQCKQCRNKEYDISEYLVQEDDLKILDNERPLGISGHLRVINEAMTVGECIDSCIDFFDELIITYNTSTDNTEEILKEYEKKYPEKIRLYHYKPNIFRYNKEYYNNIYSQIHYMDNYSNYGLLKTRYKYYLKIDADQIYFTGKLLMIRKLILSDINSIKIDKKIKKLILINKIAWWISNKKLRNKFRTYFIKKIFNKDDDYVYEGNDGILSLDNFILFAKLSSKKYRFELGGFNLSLKNNNFYLSLDYPINGAGGDTSLFILSSKTHYYIPNNAIAEHFYVDYPMYYIGFFWLHFGLIKRELNDNNSEIRVENIINTNKEKMIEYINNSSLYNDESYIKWYKPMVLNFAKSYFDEDKKYITKEFCNKYLEKPLKYAVDKKGNFTKRVAF